MRGVRRTLAFVLASSDHGTMIVNRFDYRMVGPHEGYGVGFQILDTASFDLTEVDMVMGLLGLRRKHHGDGVMAIDCGANIGVHTLEWAGLMTEWGSVLAIEAQERIFYALAGNIAINNCFNARALHAAVSSQSGVMLIPEPDYLTASSFGSLELRKRAGNEFIGQPIDYTDNRGVPIRSVMLDELAPERVDLIKIDIEGMEMEALQGGAATIEKNRPIIVVETIKTELKLLTDWLEQRGYRTVHVGINLIAIHGADPTLSDITMG